MNRMLELVLTPNLMYVRGLFVTNQSANQVARVSNISIHSTDSILSHLSPSYKRRSICNVARRICSSIEYSDNPLTLFVKLVP